MIEELRDTKAESIDKISITEFNAGVAPWYLYDFYYIYDKDDIQKVFNYLTQDIKEVKKDPILCGGRNKVFTLYINDNKYTFSTYANTLTYIDNKYKLNDSYLDLKSNIERLKKFSYKSTDIYKKDNELYKHIDNLQDFELKETSSSMNINESLYYFDVYEERAYILNPKLIYYNEVFYEVVSINDFSFLF